MEEKKYQNCPLCGTPCEVIHEHSDKPVQEIWESFWKPIVSNEDGTINIEQVKKELADFSFIMEQVPKVYCHITGDKMSKVMYRAKDVIRMADDHFNEQLREAVKEETESEIGAVWVKATSIKDCPLGYVFYKFNNGKTSYKGVGQFEEFEFVPCEDYANIRQRDYDYLEILDESGTAAGWEEFIQRIRDFNLSDVDAPVFTHTKEFAAHFSYIKGKLMDMLKVEGIAGREEDAVAFAEWIRANHYNPYGNRWRRTGSNLERSSAQLYELFKQKDKR